MAGARCLSGLHQDLDCRHSGYRGAFITTFPVSTKGLSLKVTTPGFRPSLSEQLDLLKRMERLLVTQDPSCSDCGSPRVKLIAEILCDTDNLIIDGGLLCRDCRNFEERMFAMDPQSVE